MKILTIIIIAAIVIIVGAEVLDFVADFAQANETFNYKEGASKAKMGFKSMGMDTPFSKR